MLELTIRLVLSLAVVLGLLLLIARVAGRRFRGAGDSLVRVLHRQPLSRTSAVSVVAVGTRVLVLGTTEQQVRVLAELDPEELEDTADLVALPTGMSVNQSALPAPRTLRGAHRAAVDDGGALAGSVLSPATWRQALAAATRRAS